MRDHYEEQLALLLTRVLDLGNSCHDALDDGMVYMENSSQTLYDTIVEYRKYSASQKQDIESICYQLILQQQPVASDLRLVSSSLKIASDLDRIHEQIYDIVRLGDGIRGIADTLHCRLMSMFATVENLLADCLEAYSERDIDLAFAVMNRDDEVDEAFNQIKSLLVEGIRNSDSQADEYIDVLLIVKYLEKIADHIVNIAGQTIFVETATIPVALPD